MSPEKVPMIDPSHVCHTLANSVGRLDSCIIIHLYKFLSRQSWKNDVYVTSRIRAKRVSKK